MLCYFPFCSALTFRSHKNKEWSHHTIYTTRQFSSYKKSITTQYCTASCHHHQHLIISSVFKKNVCRTWVGWTSEEVGLIALALIQDLPVAVEAFFYQPQKSMWTNVCMSVSLLLLLKRYQYSLLLGFLVSIYPCLLPTLKMCVVLNLSGFLTLTFYLSAMLRTPRHHTAING